MQIAQELAGYSLGAADILRRAMGKKKPAEMAKQRLIFVEGATERGVDEKQANTIFDQMETFAGYGFNKSHSAAYALIAYQTAWLKAHYPADFMAAVLSADMDNTDKLGELIHECRELGIDVQPPDVNRGDFVFTAENNSTIRYGLGAIKGVGRGAIEMITNSREKSGPFESLGEFCNRMDLKKLNRRAMEVLVRCGAVDELDPDKNRARLMLHLPSALQAAEQAQRDRETGQSDMFGSPAEEPIAPPAAQLDEAVRPWTPLQCLQGERDALGLYLTGHPVQLQARDLAAFTSGNIARVPNLVEHGSGGNGRRRRGTPLVLAGMVQSVRRRNNSGGFVAIEDGTGRIEASLFEETWSLYAHLMTKGEIVVIEGLVSPDEFSGGFRIRTQKVLSLVEAKNRFASGLSISLKGPDPDLADRLVSTFAPYQNGSHPVYIEYSNGRARAQLELDESHRVNACDELVAALNELESVQGAGLLYERG